MKPPAIRFAAMAKKVTATSKSQNELGPNDMRAVLPTQAPVARNSWEVDFLRPACSDVSVRVSVMYCYPYKMLSMLYSFFRHLKNMDELQRQTHLEAMALTLGITMVLTVIYGALPQANLLTSVQPANVLFVIGISYILSVITLWLRRTSE